MYHQDSSRTVRHVGENEDDEINEVVVRDAWKDHEGVYHMVKVKEFCSVMERYGDKP